MPVENRASHHRRDEVLDRKVDSGKPPGIEADFRGGLEPFEGLGLPGEYSIVAYGFSATDQNGNINTGSPASLWNTQNGAIEFTHSGFGAAGEYPGTVDSGGPAQYHAGSFTFTVVPEPSSGLLLIGASMILLVRRRQN